MKKSLRVVSRLAMLTAIGVAQLTGCSGDGSSDKQVQTEGAGSVSLALESVAPSGATYRLRNAVFLITDLRSGKVVETLFSENSPPGASVMSTELGVGNYTIGLQDGWFLERLGGGGNPVPVGGSSSGGKGGGTGVGGDTAIAGAGTGEAIDLTSGGESSAQGGESSAQGGVGGGEVPPPSRGGSPGTAGAPSGGTGTGGSGGSVGGEVVEAHLLSDAIQIFSIFGGEELFLSYVFQVGKEAIDFSKGRVHVGIEVIDDVVCVPPEGALDADRVLIEHTEAALIGFSMQDAFAAVAFNEGSTTDPVSLYQQLFDSYASAGNARLPNAVHCGDEVTDGQPSLNGFPIMCDRAEHAHIDDIQNWFATALVNRIDLAPQNGAHCGQQRMVFANPSQGRAFMIFEAQIPNPAPELGIRGCAPIAQFWLDANTLSDPFERGRRLRQAFLDGAPELLEAGVEPFMKASNLTVGSGQIRTNQFDQNPWALRDFKVALDGPALTVLPFPVAESPAGALWDESISLPQGPACRENFVQAAQGLLTDEPEAMSFVVDHACKDAESRNDFSQNYPARMTAGLRGALEEAFAGTGLSADQIATRAQFAGSCTGCHTEATGSDLGNGVQAPFSNGFTHVDEFAFPCDEGSCFPLSSALEDVFLPRRMRTLTSLLEIDPPVDNCSGSGGGTGVGGTPGSGGRMGAGGSVGGAGRSGAGGGRGGGIAGSGGATSTGGSDTGSAGEPGTGTGGSSNDPLEPGPAPEVEISLPQATTPIDELQEEDAVIREAYGDKTLGGRDARVTH